MIHGVQVLLGHPGDQDAAGNELPRLFYMSREKKPGFQHHTKVGALNALVAVVGLFFSCNLRWFSELFVRQLRVSALLTNDSYVLNLDHDHCIAHNSVLREAMCFLMDPEARNRMCFVQFPLRIGVEDDGGERHATRDSVFFDVSDQSFTCTLQRCPPLLSESRNTNTRFCDAR